MTLRYPLSGKRHATIVSAYAPTMTNQDEVKDKFYDDLDSMISATIMKTYLYNFYPLNPTFIYVVKLGFTGVYIIFLISA